MDYSIWVVFYRADPASNKTVKGSFCTAACVFLGMAGDKLPAPVLLS